MLNLAFYLEDEDDILETLLENDEYRNDMEDFESSNITLSSRLIKYHY
jgi:hypothetical protein